LLFFYFVFVFCYLNVVQQTSLKRVSSIYLNGSILVIEGQAFSIIISFLLLASGQRWGKLAGSFTSISKLATRVHRYGQGCFKAAGKLLWAVPTQPRV